MQEEQDKQDRLTPAGSAYRRAGSVRIARVVFRMKKQRKSGFTSAKAIIGEATLFFFS